MKKLVSLIMDQYIVPFSIKDFTLDLIFKKNINNKMFIILDVYTVGEIMAKTVAKAYWKEVVNCELSDLGLYEKLSFQHNVGSLSGTYDDAMEYIDKHRSNNIYAHDCSERCKKKGVQCNILYL